jgi:hypothetical protein
LNFNTIRSARNGTNFAFVFAEGESIMRKEIFSGLFWGLTLGILILFFSTANSAVVPDGSDGDIEISISGDSIRVELDKDGIVKSITIQCDSLERSPAGLKFDNELLIEDGRIYIDGVELTEQELRRLSVDQNEAVEIGWRYNHKEGRREVKRRRLATYYRHSGEDLVKFGDVEIDSAASITGDVISISGDITVFGEVKGDVVSVLGDIYLKDGAYIQGDVAAPMGRVVQESHVTMQGDVVGHREAKKGNLDLGFSARFNRVEGFTLLSNLTFEDNNGQLPKLDIGAAYAFTLKRWEYDFGIKHRFGEKLSPYFDIHFIQLAQSSDSWRFSETENSVAGLFFKEDFWDFYWSRGFDGEAGLYFTDNARAGIIYNATRISALSRTARKAIFGGDKKFRENWSTILPDSGDIVGIAGDLKEVGLKLGYDSHPDKRKPFLPGLNALVEWRKTVDAADFDYQVATVEAGALLPIATNQLVVLRGRGGYSNDYLPLFRRFFIGGIGSLRGYEYKEFQGNRCLLLSGEYIWRFYRSDFGAGIFLDSGKAALSDRAFRTGGLKTDIGISFLVEDIFRLDLAQRLDDLNRNPVISARLEMPL